MKKESRKGIEEPWHVGRQKKKSTDIVNELRSEAGELMQSVLIDTDIAIDYLRGSEEAARLLEQLWNNNTAHLSILSVYELYAGMRATEKEATEDFINACNIEPVTMTWQKREMCTDTGERRALPLRLLIVLLLPRPH